MTVSNDPHRAARTSCLDSAARWRRQATYLRQHAQLTTLRADARALLHREAEAADRQADWWLEGARELG